MKKLLLIISCFFIVLSARAQCEIGLNEIDEFDSTKVVATIPISIGYMIPSRYEEEDGPKMIEEGKIIIMYTEKDSINAFLMTIVVPEHKFLKIDKGFNVLLKLSGGEVEAIYDVPDKSEFDRSINMHNYQHSCVLTFNMYYRLTQETIEKIRINYKNKRRTITISKEQGEALKEAFRCIGTVTDYYPRY